MDVSTLHTLTEDLAAFLSEVTQGELRRPAPGTAGNVGDLYLHLIDQNVSVATAVTGEPIGRGQQPDPVHEPFLGAFVDCSGGCGLEAGYRQTARLMENAFAFTTDSTVFCQPRGFPDKVEVTTLYGLQITNTVIHTWDIAQALGFPYQPAFDITQRVLQTVARWSMQQQPGTPPGTAARWPAAVDEADTFACILKLSGRGIGSPLKAG